MRIVKTHLANPKSLSDVERAWVYNGLDACVTAEVLEILLDQLDKHTSATYAFARELQGPVLEMRLRGVKVDLRRRDEVIEQYTDLLDKLERNLERIVRESAGMIGFNWRSPSQLQELLYDIYLIPAIRAKSGNPTVNRAALERMESYTIAYWTIKHIKEMRDIQKRIDVLASEIDHDGRVRTSYNIAGTSTGRFSSSFSEFGTGGNLQNVEEGLRSVFIADEGMKLANFDAEQGESRVVGAIEWNLFRNGTYLNTCEEGDLHTSVAKLCWPELNWPHSPSGDTDLAELPYYRHYSRRFMCKKLGHGTNYGGRPKTMSTQTKIELPIIVDFQKKYFKAFPAHQMWHSWVEGEIRSYGRLVSLMGRKRHFFGRRDDDETLRAAIAYDPQGSLADIVNRDLLKVWWSGACQLLMQTHDSILVQYPEEKEDEIISKLLNLLHHEIPLQHNRTLTIPYSCKTGWNWSDYSESNPDGLKKYIPSDKRTRTT